MNRGYVKVWRKIEDSGIMGNADLCQMLMYLMLKATHKERKIAVGTQIVLLRPGQLFVGRKQLALILGSTERRVRTALSALEKFEIIGHQATNKGSVISLINWDKYQSDRPASDQHFDQQTTSDRPASDQQATTKQELKNLSIKTKGTQDAHARVDHPSEISGHDAPPPETGDRPGDVATSGAGSPPSADPPRAEPVTAPHNSAASTRKPGTNPDAYSFEFEELWDQYPRKEAKGAAWIAFKASKGAGLYPGNPIACPLVAQWRASPAWQEEGGKYVPKLSNWIRDRRWDDGPPEDDAAKYRRQVEDAMAAQEARRRIRQ